ncbi:MAG: hypothetical protein IJ747_09400 [Lachnospiraceae bacterium]|nr:hypothetical protein [Lachnospiraceae bacterium]
MSPEKKTEQTDVAETETSPLLLWEYEGYVDECIGYTWCGEFADKDFDGDGKTDRLYRTCDADRQIAEYTIEFGNGRRIQVPEVWNTGFPHIQAGDTDNDGEPEVLFTLTYDTSTDPMAFGDMWLFDYDEGSGEYRQTELPLAAGENGAKEITVSYDKPQGNVVTIKVNQTGFTESVSLEEGYLQYWWSDETVIEDETVYHAALVKNGDKTILRCFAEVFTRGVGSISFDLIYKDGAYRVENTEYGVYPENW